MAMGFGAGLTVERVFVRPRQTTRKNIQTYSTSSTPPGPRLSPRFDRLPSMSSATVALGQPGPRLNAAFYAAPVSEFLAASDEEAYAPLAAPKGYTLAPEQLSAWHLQLPVLRAALRGLARVPQEQGPVPFGDEAPAPWIHLEFDIPRLGRRVDAVLVTQKCVIPIEFKVGAKKFERLDIEQAWDYGLDLKNFHAPSHAAPIFPILCATEARESDRRWKPPHADGVRPSPTHDITRSDAGAVNLAATSGCIERIIAAAKAGRRKAIVFVTGVPGAGKTLVVVVIENIHREAVFANHLQESLGLIAREVLPLADLGVPQV